MSTLSLIQLAAILLTGLVAGLFYAYDCSVIGGLGQLGDKEYLHAFQSINKAILNPYFFLSFMGSLVVLPIATWMSYKGVSPLSFYLLLAATIFYVIGVFGVTMVANVPLNNRVEKTNLSTLSADALATLRQKFEPKWNTFNHIRTYAAILSFLLAIVSIIKR
jgi:uncharacterized membrane protein